MKQATVKFVLDDKITEVNFSDRPGLKPTTTLLNWLRSIQGHKGVKEGCGQGDCGACTVVIAETTSGGRLLYKAINSCLVFLPMNHGKQVITVENLSIKEGKKKKLHPVQQMLVETYGIQCGYCTPGMVMSLFALFKNHNNPSDEIIRDGFTGNLCRCTGYRPIMEAARKACIGNGVDHFTGKEKEIIKLLNEIKCDSKTIAIKTDRQTYLKPFTLIEAMRLKKEYPDATLINGSTDVALKQTKHKEILNLIIDVSGVEEIRFIREEKDKIVIGAGTSLEEVKKMSQTKLPSLFDMLKVFGSLQIRNLGTIGGNIATASPIGDTLPLLFALGASLTLNSNSSNRTITVEDFITGYRQTVLRKDELITEINIPVNNPETKIATYKISKRRDLDISSVSGAFRLKIHDWKVTDIALIFGGMAVRTMHATKTEKFLKGKKWSRIIVEEAMKVLAEEFSPITDARAGATFRRLAARNLLMKFYLETMPGI